VSKQKGKQQMSNDFETLAQGAVRLKAERKVLQHDLREAEAALEERLGCVADQAEGPAEWKELYGSRISGAGGALWDLQRKAGRVRELRSALRRNACALNMKRR
jgi:hypothetical protein